MAVIKADLSRDNQSKILGIVVTIIILPVYLQLARGRASSDSNGAGLLWKLLSGGTLNLPVNEAQDKSPQLTQNSTIVPLSRSSSSYKNDDAQRRIMNSDKTYLSDADSSPYESYNRPTNTICTPSQKAKSGSGWGWGWLPQSPRKTSVENMSRADYYAILGGLSFASFIATALVLLSQRNVNGTAVRSYSSRRQDAHGTMLQLSDEKEAVQNSVEEQYEMFIRVPRLIYKLSTIISPLWYVKPQEEEDSRKHKVVKFSSSRKPETRVE